MQDRSVVQPHLLIQTLRAACVYFQSCLIESNCTNSHPLSQSSNRSIVQEGLTLFVQLQEAWSQSLISALRHHHAGRACQVSLPNSVTMLFSTFCLFDSFHLGTCWPLLGHLCDQAGIGFYESASAEGCDGMRPACWSQQSRVVRCIKTDTAHSERGVEAVAMR